ISQRETFEQFGLCVEMSQSPRDVAEAGKNAGQRDVDPSEPLVVAVSLGLGWGQALGKLERCGEVVALRRRVASEARIRRALASALPLLAQQVQSNRAVEVLDGRFTPDLAGRSK